MFEAKRQCPSSHSPAPFKPLGTRRGHPKWLLQNPTGCSCAGPRTGGAGQSPFPGCFWEGVSAEAPGGALNLPQECRRVYMPASSTPLFSQHPVLRGGRGQPLAKRNLRAEPRRRHEAPVCVGGTTSRHSTGQVRASPAPAQVGAKSWTGRACGSGGNLGSFPQGWLSATPCGFPKALILERETLRAYRIRC